MTSRVKPADRRYFIGGSDARLIMGQDEGALLRLWREKRGEVEPKDLSGNLIVQLGLVTEPLNRLWYERNTGQALTAVQSRVQHPVVRRMCATLDGMEKIGPTVHGVAVVDAIVTDAELKRLNGLGMPGTRFNLVPAM